MQNMQKTRIQRSRFAGFTLIQILVVLGIVAVLAAMLVGNFSRGREGARRAQCDVHLKAVVLALDAYRQENGRFPSELASLRQAHYLEDDDALHCPSDPKTARDSYAEFYAIRAPRDNSELPIVVCPFHEEAGRHGVQAFKGRYTAQFATSPATLEAANAATVQHPKEDSAISATAGMTLRGGDRIRTTGGGGAKIRFADGTTATLRGGSDVTVLQSFVQGRMQAPLYTLVRQSIGDVVYEINHGSKFDVVTPTATAGAHGTAFRIVVSSDGTTRLWVNEGKVSLTTTRKTGMAPSPSKEWLTVTPVGDVIGDLLNDVLGGLL
ncbi:MAG TPA: FecR domain-containing protein [Abditibacteriaceae bacterium]|jgi:type II secretory pathway pseudopilin PulG